MAGLGSLLWCRRGRNRGCQLLSGGPRADCCPACFGCWQDSVPRGVCLKGRRSCWLSTGQLICPQSPHIPAHVPAFSKPATLYWVLSKSLDFLFCHRPNSRLLKGWCDEINPTWVINLLRNSRSTDKFLLLGNRGLLSDC